MSGGLDRMSVSANSLSTRCFSASTSGAASPEAIAFAYPSQMASQASSSDSLKRSNASSARIVLTPSRTRSLVHGISHASSKSFTPQTRRPS